MHVVQKIIFFFFFKELTWRKHCLGIWACLCLHVGGQHAVCERKTRALGEQKEQREKSQSTKPGSLTVASVWAVDVSDRLQALGSSKQLIADIIPCLSCWQCPFQNFFCILYNSQSSFPVCMLQCARGSALYCIRSSCHAGPTHPCWIQKTALDVSETFLITYFLPYPERIL